jgi:hypothetical protein
MGFELNGFDEKYITSPSKVNLIYTSMLDDQKCKS